MPSSEEGRRPNVLVVYGVLQYPLRTWFRDHLYAFGRHSRSRCFYLNVGIRRAPRWLRKIRFDAVLFHNTLTGQRMSPPILSWQLRRARALKDVAPIRIAMIQDECIYTDLMSEFIDDFDINHVFSVAPPSQWETIYPGVDRDRVNFHEALTGYLEDDTVARIDRIVAETRERPIDIGYRAWAGLMSFGRHGLLRQQLADAVGPAAEARGLRTDMSTSLADTHHGDDWYRFLASCKYVIGAEGGATVLDRSGEFRLRTERYLDQHPDADFEQVEAACFPGEDGKLQLFAISPRQIEACATRTCQVLVEGSYSGVLRPGEHYLELKKDLSNLDQVMDEIERDDARQRLTENAYRDVVASGAYSYGRFAAQIEREAGLDEVEPATPYGRRVEARYRRSVWTDRLSWVKVAVYVRGARLLQRIARLVLPRRIVGRVRDRLAGGQVAS